MCFYTEYLCLNTSICSNLHYIEPCFYFHQGAIFGLSVPIDGEPATHGNGSTIGFNVESPEQGDAWHTAGVANGGVTCEDPPGVREADGMYLAYLRDPAGNKICALKRMG